MDEDLNINIVRNGSKDIVKAGDTVNQTLKIYNNSEYILTNIGIKDEFSEDVTFVNRSVVVEGTSHGDANPLNGFKITETLTPKNSLTITYSIKISSDPTIKKFTNVSNVTFTANSQEYIKKSNVYTMELGSGELQVVKSAPIVAKKGQQITYETVITNVGNLRNTNIYFKDPIPTGTTFVDGSVSIDDVSKDTYNPETGFSLSNLDPNSKVSVKFDVLIDN